MYDFIENSRKQRDTPDLKILEQERCDDVSIYITYGSYRNICAQLIGTNKIVLVVTYSTRGNSRDTFIDPVK